MPAPISYPRVIDALDYLRKTTDDTTTPEAKARYLGVHARLCCAMTDAEMEQYKAAKKELET